MVNLAWNLMSFGLLYLLLCSFWFSSLVIWSEWVKGIVKLLFFTFWSRIRSSLCNWFEWIWLKNNLLVGIWYLSYWLGMMNSSIWGWTRTCFFRDQLWFLHYFTPLCWGSVWYILHYHRVNCIRALLHHTYLYKLIGLHVKLMVTDHNFMWILYSFFLFFFLRLFERKRFF